jgi:hypothetical protein
MVRAVAILVCCVGLAGAAAAQTILDLPTTSLVLKDDPGGAPKARYVKVRSSTKSGQVAPGEDRIVPPAPGGAGDPTLHGATFTIYNVGGNPQVHTATLPAAFWRINGSPSNHKGWLFKDTTTGDGPIFRIYLKPDKLFVIGGRDLWGYRLEATPQVRVAWRLQLGTDVVLCGEAPAKSPAASYDNALKFFTPRALAPSPCTPIP